jgi:hypothetical protein
MPPNTEDGVRAEPQDPLSESVSTQDQDQTASLEYCEAKSNDYYGSEKGLGKSTFLSRENSGGFHAQVVVLNHPLGSPRASHKRPEVAVRPDVWIAQGKKGLA